MAKRSMYASSLNTDEYKGGVLYTRCGKYHAEPQS